MASPVTVSDFLNGVGEFLKLTDHMRRSLFPKEDRDQGIAVAMEPYNVAAWEQAVNDVRDIHDKDITASMTEAEETTVKAAVCNLIAGLMFDQSSSNPKDPKAYQAKKYFRRYRAIIGRTKIFTVSGRSVNVAQEKRLVRS